MFLLLGGLRDLDGEGVRAGRRADRQRHLFKPGLRRAFLARNILRGRLRAARGERSRGGG
jgi:hypothetical protein